MQCCAARKLPRLTDHKSPIINQYGVTYDRSTPGFWHCRKLHILAKFSIAQRAFLALCVLLFSGCSTPCRQWELQEVLTRRPCFNAGRIILGPDSDFSYLEMEITRNRSGIRSYINLLLMEAPPTNDDSCRTKVNILFDNQDPWIIQPYLLEGGQRLLLPREVSEQLIQALNNDRPFSVKIGRNQLTVIPDNFATTYEKLLALPIEEDIVHR